MKPIILLDEPILGIDVFLRDKGWDVKTVREELGEGKSDDQVVELAKKGGYVVVTPDRKLVKRCRLLGVRVIELGVEMFAEVVNRELSREFPAEY